MRYFSRRFWHDFWFDPRALLEQLKNERSKLGYPLVKVVLFFRILYSEYMNNHCLTRASALAFALLLTLIPLMASATYMLANVVEVKSAQLQHVLALFLPFAPPVILDTIGQFLTNAQKLRGLGVTILILVTVGLFGAVEEALNTIWKVGHSRAFFKRLRTFTMVMVYAPVLFFASTQIRRSIELNFMPGYYFYFPLGLLPFVLSALSFTSLIWIVPNTKVHFRFALSGGLLAGILFELERRWFGHYVQMSSQTSTIYGPFGILLFFMLSLFVVSLFILLGAQLAYVCQNFWPLLRSRKRWDRRVSDHATYIALRMFIDVFNAFYKRKQPIALGELLKKYELTESQGSGIFHSLIYLGFVHKIDTGGKYVPASDYAQVPVITLINALENQHRKVPVSPNDFTREYLEKMFGYFNNLTIAELSALTFAQLIDEVDKGEERYRQVVALAQLNP